MRFWITNPRSARIKTSVTYKPKTWKVEKLEDKIPKLSDKDKLKLKIAQIILERLTGKRVKFALLEKEISTEPQETIDTSQHAVESNQPQGWGFVYENKQVYSEEERLQFNAKALVKTSDGRQINVSIQLSVNRAFYQENSFEIRAGDALKDPLVINFDGQLDFSSQTYSFDLDLDGTADNIKMPDSGSGFLALDLNKNGKIDSGRELFGPKTGNGFEELKAYDSDKNNWIDEADPIFEKLRIWAVNEEGEYVLFSLKEKGIGAIFLGSTTTPFTYTESNNSPIALLKRSGIYLKENGDAGTVQQIDFVV